MSLNSLILELSQLSWNFIFIRSPKLYVGLHIYFVILWIRRYNIYGSTRSITSLITLVLQTANAATNANVTDVKEVLSVISYSICSAITKTNSCCQWCASHGDSTLVTVCKHTLLERHQEQCNGLGCWCFFWKVVITILNIIWI